MSALERKIQENKNIIEEWYGVLLETNEEYIKWIESTIRELNIIYDDALESEQEKEGCGVAEEVLREMDILGDMAYDFERVKD